MADGSLGLINVEITIRERYSFMRELLSVSAVRSIFFAQFISVAGDKMFAIALAWWVVEREDLSNRELMLGLLLAITTLPIALSGTLVGPFIDRFNRRSCMMVADVGRLLLMAGLGVLLYYDSLSMPILFMLCIPLFALEPLFDSAVSASLASISKNPLMLAQLVALESAMPHVGYVAGAMAGGLALSVWNVEGAVWFNACTFLVSLTCVATLPALSPPAADPNKQEPSGCYSFLKKFPTAARLLVIIGIVNFFIAPVFLYLPLLVRDVLEGDGSQLGLLEMAFASGNLLLFGYFFLMPTEFSRSRWLTFFLAASSAGLLWILGNTETLWTMFAILVGWGMLVAFVSYLVISSFQRTIPDEFKGRFFALLTSFCTISFPLSFTCFGLLTSHFSLQKLIFSNAACTLLVSFCFLTVPDEKR